MSCSTRSTVSMRTSFTTRFIIQQTHVDDPQFFEIEDDESIKANFRALVQRVDSGEVQSAAAFESEYMEIVCAGRSDSAKHLFTHFGEIIDGLHEAEWEMYKTVFFLGADQTSAHLSKKLGDDLKGFQTQGERILSWLDRYKFINGWITAFGIFILSLFSPVVQWISAWGKSSPAGAPYR